MCSTEITKNLLRTITIDQTCFFSDLEGLTDDQQLDMMSNLLIQKMHLFNFKQLRQLLQYLTLLHTKSSRFVTLAETIDEYLLASIKAHGVTEVDLSFM